MKELLTALVAAKSAFTSIKKDKANPFHKSKYATLDSVLSAVEPSLLANELVLVQTVAEGFLITTLWHTSGQSLTSSFRLPELNDPQKLGSQITYYRRYAVCALLSVTADEDDDGNAAKPVDRSSPSQPVSSRSSAPSPVTQPKSPPSPTVPDSEIATRKQALKECMEILNWDAETKSAWSKSVCKSPFNSWTLNDWDRGVSMALSEIDKLNDDTSDGIAFK